MRRLDLCKVVASWQRRRTRRMRPTTSMLGTASSEARDSGLYSQSYSSLFRPDPRAPSKPYQGPNAEDAAARKARDELVARVEISVRDRLRAEFPREFEVSWFATSSHADAVPITLSSVRTLLALNGFQRVVKPAGNHSRLYLAEGVVATPPMKLSFQASAIPFASGYQEFARGMDIGNAGFFGDVHHHVKVTQRKDRLFAQPFRQVSHLHPDDAASAPKRGSSSKTRPSSSSSPSSLSSSSSHPKDFPEFVQEDITVYRLLENSAARVLDRTYSSWTGMIQKAFVRPMKDAKYRTRVAIKSANAMRAKFHQVLEKSILERIWEEFQIVHDRIGKEPTPHIGQSDNNNNNNKNNSNTVVAAATASTTENDPVASLSKPSNPASSSQTESQSSDDKPEATTKIKSEKKTKEVKSQETSLDSDSKDKEITEDNDPLETLVVISSRPRPGLQSGGSHQTSTEEEEIVESISLYRRMTPSTRILALPDYYVLRHSSASTLVSVSLVVFGALPLAYRSYMFSIDYDWLVGSGTIATSVIATITYGIVSWRWRARTSQSKTLHEALGARVAARDEAALLLLKEGAIRSVAREVVGASVPAHDDGVYDESDATPQTSSSSSSNVTSLIDPIEWAVDFGVLEASSSSSPNEQAGLEKPQSL